MKKAFIDQILLAFLLFSGVFILIATISDDTKVRNKYYNLKELTDNAVLSAAKHYIENEDTQSAETIALNIVSQTNLGLEVINDITFTWDLVSTPKNVIAAISDYDEPTFWYRLLNLDILNLGKIESKANIIEDIKERTSNFAPIAINECERNDLFDGNQLTFEFHSYTEFNNFDTKAFYGVTEKCSEPHGNSFFADYKNIYNNPSFDEYDNTFLTDVEIDVHNDVLCLPQTDFENPDTVDSKQFYDKLKRFPVGSRLEIALLDCDSEAANINVNNLVIIELQNEATCTQGHFENSENWLNRVWIEERNNCNGGNYDYKLLKVDAKIIIEDKAVLVY